MNDIHFWGGYIRNTSVPYIADVDLHKNLLFKMSPIISDGKWHEKIIIRDDDGDVLSAYRQIKESTGKSTELTDK